MPVGLVDLNIYLLLMYTQCNAEENAESVPTLINSIRMIIVHMMMNGLDAVKIASLISSYQEYPYQHTTTFGRITIMSDIIRVGGYELFFEVFAELSLLYKQSVDRLRNTVTDEIPLLVIQLIHHSSDTFLSYSDLLDPIKAMEKRSNDGVPEFIPHSTWTLGDNSNKYFNSYCGFEQKLSGSSLDMLQKRRDWQWEISFDLLKQFKLDNGHCNVLKKYETDKGVKLGYWLHTQRQSKKKKILKDNRRELLENLGVVWVVKKVNVESN